MGDTTGLEACRRVVVKLGTNTVSGPLGDPDPWYLGALASDVQALREEGKEVILVSSGAIGAGRAVLGLREKPRDVRVRQACAAVGQPRLMDAWDRAFSRHGVRVAQVLVTYHTFADRQSYLNLRNTLEALLEMGVVPVVNENDTVSIEEITDADEAVEDAAGGFGRAGASFGDNDRLSALVATKMEADLLVILSDVKGLYSKPPGVPGAALVPVVEGVDDAVLEMAGAKASGAGRGGMRSKLASARLATGAGIPVVIAHGRESRGVPRLLAGEALGTRFLPVGHAEGPKRWLLIAPPEGRVHVDAGAADALRHGKHLLPAGVTGVDGNFDVESVVDVVHGGAAVARAVSQLSSRDLLQAKGLQSGEVRRVLGITGSVNVTRKGFVVLLDDGKA